MPGWADDFGAFDGNVWLNAAHQGALPKLAASAAAEAVAWKRQPWQLTTERFSGVPQRVRTGIGRLIGARAEDVILANSASYGLHLIANGIPWQPGDEVLTMRGDFPSDILPWLGLADRGVTVTQLRPSGRVLSAAEIDRAIGPRTRLLCLTWVHSLSGFAIDLEGVGRLCRERGVIFVVNGSQAVGVRSLSVADAPIDALVSVGFKWLCGPYGTGFCWIRPDLRETLRCPKTYWLSMLTSDDLAKDDLDLILREDAGARRWDIFGTANFFNFHAWGVCLDYLDHVGLAAIAAHDSALVDRFVAGLDRTHYQLLSPEEGPARSTLTFFAPNDRRQTAACHQALRTAGVHVAMRAGALRLAPHLYNTDEDIDRALDCLAQASSKSPSTSTAAPRGSDDAPTAQRA
ncbi:MAG: aminotransferase class V-fold PLP-dependent enzyme [Rhodospirillales bacterium]